MIHNFLGSKISENYADVVQDMCISQAWLSYAVTDSLHFLHSHLDFFLDNLGDVSDERVERFYQDISQIETRYQGKPGNRMMDDYCWYLHRETDASNRHKARV